jgi:hypothetical protein
MRTVRKVLGRIGLDPNLMKHGVGREVFACPVASNALDVLSGNTSTPTFALPTVQETSAKVIARWIVPRAERRPEYKLWTVEMTKALLKKDKSYSDSARADNHKAA